MSGYTELLPLPGYAQVKACKEEYQGPTEESNWVIPGRLMVGAYPGEALDDMEHMRTLRSLLALGIATFVCLQEEYVHRANISEEDWKRGRFCRPYIFDALALCKEERFAGQNSQYPRPEELTLLHVPIRDFDCSNDEVVIQLARVLIWRLKRGEKIYVHCWGGHGRTGTITAVILGLLYDLTATDALRRTQFYHDLRVNNLHVGSPQTPEQCLQVVRVLDTMRQPDSCVPKEHAEDLGSIFVLPTSSGEVQASAANNGVERQTVHKML